MAVYTIVFTFRGTPVTRQVTANTQNEALELWAKGQLPEAKTPDVSLTEAVEKEKLVPIRGLTNVWTAFLSLGRENGVVIVSVTQVDAVYPRGDAVILGVTELDTGS